MAKRHNPVQPHPLPSPLLNAGVPAARQRCANPLVAERSRGARLGRRALAEPRGAPLPTGLQRCPLEQSRVGRPSSAPLPLPKPCLLGDAATLCPQMESACVTIHEALNAVIDSQTHYRLREAQDRSRAEDLNGRVSYWSVGETVILFVVSVGQVMLLKSFFTEKRPGSSAAGT